MGKKYGPESYVHEYKTRGYNLNYKAGETDAEYYKRLAKVADQRLVRLEQLAQQPGFEKVKLYAYDKAMRDLESYGGGSRFNTKIPTDENGVIDSRLLSQKLADMRAFLSSVTSTKQGIQSVYTERVKSINEKYGTSYSWQDLADFYQSGDAKKAIAYGNSDLVLRAIGKIQKARAQLNKEMAANAKITLDKKNNDKVIYDKANDILKGHDLDLSILKGLDSSQRNRMGEILAELEVEERKK